MRSHAQPKRFEAKDSKLFNERGLVASNDESTFVLDFLRLSDAYIVLTDNVTNIVIDKGAYALYRYRTGCGSYADVDLAEVHLSNHASLSETTHKKLMETFINSCIKYNCNTIYMKLSNLLIDNINRNFGKVNCLSAGLIKTLKLFNQNRISSVSDNDIAATAVACMREASFAEPTGLPSAAIIKETIERCDTLLRSVDSRVSFRRLHLPILKIVHSLICVVFNVHSPDLRLDSVTRSKDDLHISDTTLAAIPFAPQMYLACVDDSQSSSRQGIEFMQSLDGTLRRFVKVPGRVSLPVARN